MKQYLIKKREKIGPEHCQKSKVPLKFSHNLDDIYANMEGTLEECNRIDYAIADILSNKKLQQQSHNYLLEV